MMGATQNKYINHRHYYNKLQQTETEDNTRRDTDVNCINRRGIALHNVHAVSELQ